MFQSQFPAGITDGQGILEPFKLTSASTGA
jgi:hypothetical protein